MRKKFNRHCTYFYNKHTQPNLCKGTEFTQEHKRKETHKEKRN